MTVQFKAPGVPLFKSTGVVAMDADCCCEVVCCEDNCYDPTVDYDWAVIICNVNAIRDDEFNVFINGNDAGALPDIGQDLCKGRFFTTHAEFPNAIKNLPAECAVGVACCKDNTTAQTVVPVSYFLDNVNPIVIFMDNTRDNGSANFGLVQLFRREVGSNIICSVATENYAGFRGADITVNLTQTLCP